MDQLINPENPQFRAAVVEVIDDRLNERVTTRVDAILTRIRTDLEQRGFAEAATYVRRTPGE